MTTKPRMGAYSPCSGDYAPFEAWLSYEYLSAEPKKPLVSTIRIVVRLDRLARSLVHMAKLGEELESETDRTRAPRRPAGGQPDAPA